MEALSEREERAIEHRGGPAKVGWGVGGAAAAAPPRFGAIEHKDIEAVACLRRTDARFAVLNAPLPLRAGGPFHINMKSDIIK